MRPHGLLSGCFVFFAMLSTAAFAGGRAVEATNFSIGLNEEHWEYSDPDGKGDQYGATAALTVPVGDRAGFSLAGLIGKYRSTSYYGGDEFEWTQNYTLANAGVFVRDPEIGRVSLAYVRTRWGSGHSTIEAVETVSSTFSCPEAHAEYYFERVSVGASRIRCENSHDDNVSNSSAVFARWYATPNLDVSAVVHGMDSKDTYGAAVEYQPDFAGNSLGFRLGYMRDRADNDSTNIVTLAVRYYFDTRVDLKSRDRRYRAQNWMMLE